MKINPLKAAKVLSALNKGDAQEVVGALRALGIEFGFSELKIEDAPEAMRHFARVAGMRGASLAVINGSAADAEAMALVVMVPKVPKVATETSCLPSTESAIVRS